MYNVGDLIMYGGTGVCEVKEITRPNFGGETVDQDYYILQPLYQRGTIYAPVDNEKVFTRPVISAQEADDLISIIPEVHTEIYKSSSTQQLTKHYQSVIDTHKTVDLVRLAKSIHQKMDAAHKQNRHLGQIDKKFMKRAEDLLYGELAAALDIPREDILNYIEERLDQKTDADKTEK